MIDTLDKPGYICDRDVNDKVPEIACKTLGLNGGGAAKKMPRSIYGNPQSPGERPLFVLKRLHCSGSERSVVLEGASIMGSPGGPHQGHTPAYLHTCNIDFVDVINLQQRQSLEVK